MLQDFYRSMIRSSKRERSGRIESCEVEARALLHARSETPRIDTACRFANIFIGPTKYMNTSAGRFVLTRSIEHHLFQA